MLKLNYQPIANRILSFFTIYICERRISDFIIIHHIKLNILYSNCKKKRTENEKYTWNIVFLTRFCSNTFKFLYLLNVISIQFIPAKHVLFITFPYFKYSNEFSLYLYLKYVYKHRFTKDEFFFLLLSLSLWRFFEAFFFSYLEWENEK